VHGSGARGLTAVVRALDGRGRPTQLTERLAALYPEIRPDQPRTIVAAYNERLFDYSTLTPLVMACAAAGDEVCREILVRAAHHLAELLRALLRHFPTRPVPLVLMGGMLENHTPLAELFRRELQKLPEYALQPAQGNGAGGRSPHGAATVSASTAAAELMSRYRILPWNGNAPRLAPDVWIADGVCLIGDVSIGSGSSVWFNSVVRADVHWIRIGEGTNIQDPVRAARHTRALPALNR
jgi:hypothetical protein